MSKTIRFTVPGKPVGYYAMGKRPNWTRLREYVEYKQLVQQHAVYAGLKLPLEATLESPVYVNTVTFFKNGVHCDPGNVQKGICDALFYQQKLPGETKRRRKGGDKYTGGKFEPPHYDKRHPRVEVEVLICEPATLFEGVES